MSKLTLFIPFILTSRVLWAVSDVPDNSPPISTPPVVTDKSMPSARFVPELRLDLQSGTNRWDNQLPTNQDADVFTNTYARFNLFGIIDQKTTYRIRYQAHDTTSAAGGDRLDAAFEYLYVDHYFTDWFMLRFGKQFVQVSSWEYNYKAYTFTQTFAEAAGFYKMGVELGFDIASQHIGIQLLDSTPAGAPKRAKNWIKGIYWWGHLNNDMFEPILSYLVFPVAGYVNGDVTTQNASDSTQTAIGTKVRLGQVDFDLVWGRVTNAPQLETVAGGTTAVPTTTEFIIPGQNWETGIFYIRYKFHQPRLDPFLKISQDEGFVGGQKAYHFLRTSVGVEYFPTSERYRLHLVYVNQYDKYTGVSVNNAKYVKKNGVTADKSDGNRLSEIITGVGVDF